VRLVGAMRSRELGVGNDAVRFSCLSVKDRPGVANNDVLAAFLAYSGSWLECVNGSSVANVDPREFLLPLRL